MESKKRLSISKIIAGLAIIASIIGAVPIVQVWIKEWRTKEFEGQWKFTFNILKSTYKRYVGKSCGWKIYMTQEGDKVSGKGEMFWVDQKEIPYEQHIPITVTGKITGKEVKMTYIQDGAKRQSYGDINLEVISAELAKGMFTGTAANSSGNAIAERIN